MIDCNGYGIYVAGIILGFDCFINDIIGVVYEAKWMSGIVLSGSCDNNMSIVGIIGMF